MKGYVHEHAPGVVSSVVWGAGRGFGETFYPHALAGMRTNVVVARHADASRGSGEFCFFVAIPGMLVDV